MEKKLTYSEKKQIADNYLDNVCGLSWDELPDINSLRDADNKKEIILLCKDRLNEESFPWD